ncbi:hypothetical protein QOZ80_3AG0209400 [Eleusine coracana subsp. coracana]|nr:hypothetical protein QOZ80_3AG0209400 [Eleusine coracana subsp. coracana]
MTGPRGKRKAEASRASNPSAQATIEAAPPARRSRCVPAAPAPPPECEVPDPGTARPPSTVHTREVTHFDVTHRLRSGRKVVVPKTVKLGPMEFRKGERPMPDASWRTPACAEVGLERYNRLNEEDEHELVKPIESIVFFFNGQWMHANFLAKPKGATSCVKYFFAEMKIGPEGKEKLSCVSCIKMDPVNPKTKPVHGCKTCPSRILHPAAGAYQGGTV